LAVIFDLYSRRVVGWALAENMRTELVCIAPAHDPRPALSAAGG
jgi:transposase InsO family protein